MYNSLKNTLSSSFSTHLSPPLLFFFLCAFPVCRRKLDPTSADDKAFRTDSLRLFPPNTVASYGVHKQRTTANRTIENFLYLGTLSNAKGNDEQSVAATSNASSKFGVSSRSGSPYQKLGSPELTSLPPLPKNNFIPSHKHELGSDDDEGEDEFFSPRGSSASLKNVVGASSDRVLKAVEGDNFGSRSFNSRTASYPCSKSASPVSSVSNTISPQLNFSPTSLKSNSPDSVINFMAPSRPAPIPVAVSRSLSSSSILSERVSGNVQSSPDFVTQMKQSLVRNNSACFDLQVE